MILKTIQCRFRSYIQYHLCHLNNIHIQLKLKRQYNFIEDFMKNKHNKKTKKTISVKDSELFVNAVSADNNVKAKKIHLMEKIQY